MSIGTNNTIIIPHRGALYEYDDDYNEEDEYYYNNNNRHTDKFLCCIEIVLQESKETHELKYTRYDLEFAQRLFSILDIESHGSITYTTIKEFVTLRCPIFQRRDEDLQKQRKQQQQQQQQLDKTTFDEIWESVILCSNNQEVSHTNMQALLSRNQIQLGIEGFMVFCRFIALAQYLEAKRRFSSRHLQQTMRHRNSPRGSEVVVVDVPPLKPIVSLTPQQLVYYETKSTSSASPPSSTYSPLPLPELDLDHTSLLNVHNNHAHNNATTNSSTHSRSNNSGTNKKKHYYNNTKVGYVQVTLFGNSNSSSSSASKSSSSFSKSLLSKTTNKITSSNDKNKNVEFMVTYVNNNDNNSSSSNTVVVRRSFDDIKWLNDTFTSHKVLGGTLCGRILPPFPIKTKKPSSSSSSSSSTSSMMPNHSGGSNCAGGNGSSSSNSAASVALDKVDYTYQTIKGTTGKTIAAATVGVGMIRDVAKSYLKSYLLSPTITTPSIPAGVVAPSAAVQPTAATPPLSGTTTTAVDTNNKKNKKHSHSKKTISWTIPESYYNPNSPEGKARQIERYLNYLLQHPALSTSFPLNTILKASQSGLEAAKQMLEECSRKSKEMNDQAPRLDDGGKSAGIHSFWPSSTSSTAGSTSTTGTGHHQYYNNSNINTLSWVRTAAQAAMALQLHGILETTGMQSASARLQHASLPTFINPPSIRNGDWECDDDNVDAMDHVDNEEGGNDVVISAGEGVTETATTISAQPVSDDDTAGVITTTANAELLDEDNNSKSHKKEKIQPSPNNNDFEQGVICVQSELQGTTIDAGEEDGYDLLPLPVPAPERQILSLGSSMMISTTPHENSRDSVGDGSTNNNMNNNNSNNLSSLENERTNSDDNNNNGTSTAQEVRFQYGPTNQSNNIFPRNTHNKNGTYLGDVFVDEHIDKLREVIGSVDNTLSRCLASSGIIGRSRRENLTTHLNIVRGLDSWEGLQGKFISQRALLKGVSGIEQSTEIFEESDLSITDDVSWQTCLASSAVSAAEDVRSAVRAARTAANAKAATSAAAAAAQNACENGTFQSTDEARAAQTRASMAQSHAFHAAVVEHEANAVKRRATLALAHDVKCWNVHRKREMLKACLSYAKSQHEATRRSVDAWSCLRDGYIQGTATALIQTTQKTRKQHQNPNHATTTNNQQRRRSRPSPLSQQPSQLRTTPRLQPFQSQTSNNSSSSINTDWSSASCYEQDEVTARIYQDLGDNNNNNGDGQPVIVAVDHDILTRASLCNPTHVTTTTTDALDGIVIATSTDNDDNNSSNNNCHHNLSSETEKNMEYDDLLSPPESILPLVTASPIPEEEFDYNNSNNNDINSGSSNIHGNSANGSSHSNSKISITSGGSINNNTNGSSFFDDICSSSNHSHRGLSVLAATTATTTSEGITGEKNTEKSTISTASSTSENATSSNNNNHVLSASMQSLVDGLMSWGDQFDVEDDFALPTGMAASIIMEENGVL